MLISTLVANLFVSQVSPEGAKGLKDTGILSFEFHSGFTLPSHQQSRRCWLGYVSSDADADKKFYFVEDSREIAGVTVTKRSRIDITASVYEKINEAFLGEVVIKEIAIDGGQHTWTAIRKNKDSGQPEKVVLRAEGNNLTENRSDAAASLVLLIDSICPQ